MIEQNFNWHSYLLEIIDGKYAFDIQKTGDSSSFIKNQIESRELVNLEYDNFKNGLKQLFSESPLIYSIIIDNVDKYLFLVEWGIKFLFDSEFIFRKYIVIQNIFYENDFYNITEEGVRKIEALLIKTNLGIVVFIESFITQHIVLENEKLVDKIEYSKTLKVIWESKISQRSKLNDANILKGIIYLDLWASIELEKRQQFFVYNKENVQLFSVLLFDLKRLEKSKKINYFSFIEDIKHYYSEFIEVIQSSCPSWLVDNKKGEVIITTHNYRVWYNTESHIQDKNTISKIFKEYSSKIEQVNSEYLRKVQLESEESGQDYSNRKYVERFKNLLKRSGRDARIKRLSKGGQVYVSKVYLVKEDSNLSDKKSLIRKEDPVQLNK